MSLDRRVDATDPADRLLEATLPAPSGHRDGDASRALRLIAERPSLTRANVWVAAATGEVAAVRGFLAADIRLATAEGGTRRWDPLLYLAFSRLLRTDDERAGRMLEIARLLLDSGADPNTHWIDASEGRGNRESALYGAAGVANRVELARLLVERGADPNDGETAYHMVEHDGVPCADFLVPKLEPIHRGAALGHKLDYDDLAGLRKLLDLGIDPNGPTPFANLPLHQAVWRGRGKEFFDVLLSCGADVNRPNRDGKTAYALAARAGKREIMDWLVEAGASTDLEPTDRFLAACAAGDRAAAERALADTPDLLASLTDRDRAEICEAAAAGNTAGVARMLDLGWDVDTRGVTWSETPAHRAALDGRLDTLRLLVEHGADLTITDRQYRTTPLAWGMHGGKPGVVEYFRSLPDRLDAWDAIELGLTGRVLALLPSLAPDASLRGAAPGGLLRLAAGKGLEDVVRAMLARGADPTLCSSQDQRPIDLAREAGHTAIVRILEEHEQRSRT